MILNSEFMSLSIWRISVGTGSLLVVTHHQTDIHLRITRHRVQTLKLSESWNVCAYVYMQTQTLTWHFTWSAASVTNTSWLMEVPSLAQGGDKQPIAALKPFLHDLERALYMEIDLRLLLAQLALIWPSSSVKNSTVCLHSHVQPEFRQSGMTLEIYVTWKCILLITTGAVNSNISIGV